MLVISFVLWVWSAFQFAATVRVVPELEYNLKDIVNWGRNSHDDSNAVKAQYKSFNAFSNSKKFKFTSCLGEFHLENALNSPKYVPFYSTTLMPCLSKICLKWIIPRQIQFLDGWGNQCECDISNIFFLVYILVLKPLLFITF